MFSVQHQNLHVLFAHFTFFFLFIAEYNKNLSEIPQRPPASATSSGKLIVILDGQRISIDESTADAIVVLLSTVHLMI